MGIPERLRKVCQQPRRLLLERPPCNTRPYQSRRVAKKGCLGGGWQGGRKLSSPQASSAAPRTKHFEANLLSCEAVAGGIPILITVIGTLPIPLTASH